MGARTCPICKGDHEVGRECASPYNIIAGRDATIAQLQLEILQWKAHTEVDEPQQGFGVLTEERMQQMGREREIRAALEAERPELEMAQDLAIRLGDKCRAIANIVKGDPGPDALHSTHDIVERVEAQVARVAELEAKNRQLVEYIEETIAVVQTGAWDKISIQLAEIRGVRAALGEES